MYSVRRLAEILDTTPKAIYELLRRSPSTLPRAVRLGSWRLRFIDVEGWLSTLIQREEGHAKADRSTRRARR